MMVLFIVWSKHNYNLLLMSSACTHMLTACTHMSSACTHMSTACTHMSSACMHMSTACTHMSTACMHMSTACTHMLTACTHIDVLCLFFSRKPFFRCGVTCASRGIPSNNTSVPSLTSFSLSGTKRYVPPPRGVCY